MVIQSIVWLPQFEEKIERKHGIIVEEVEEVLFGKSRIRFIEQGTRQDEDLYSASGQTEAGRYLVVFFILKNKREALILSARDMDRKERKSYGRRK